MFRSNAAAATVACIFCLIAPGARAENRADDSSEDLIRQAVALRRSGDDAGAYPLLVQAHTASHSPRSAAQRGLCEQALGRWLDAEAHMTEALKATGDPWVKKSRPTLEMSLAVVKAHIGHLEVAGEPAGAEVVINGTSAGHLPLAAPVGVAAGDVDVELRAAGFASATKTVRVDGGGYRKVEIRAASEARASARSGASPTATSATSDATTPGLATGAASATSMTAAAATPGTVEPSSTARGSSPEANPSEADAGANGGAGPGRRALKWISWGAGAVSLGFGVFELSRQSSAGTEFDGSCGIDATTGKPMSADPSKKTDQQCADLKSRVDSSFRLELIGFVGAAVLGAAGLVLWLTEPDGKDGAAKISAATCAPGLSRAGGPWMTCLWRF